MNIIFLIEFSTINKILKKDKNSHKVTLIMLILIVHTLQRCIHQSQTERLHCDHHVSILYIIIMFFFYIMVRYEWIQTNNIHYWQLMGHKKNFSDQTSYRDDSCEMQSVSWQLHSFQSHSLL